MEHKKYKELLNLLFIGEISDSERDILKVHVSSCPECRKEMELLQKLDEYLSTKSSFKVPETLLQNARSGLRDRLRIEQAKQNKSSDFIEKIKGFFSFNYKYILNGAASAAAGILIGFILFNNPGQETNLTQNLSAVSDFPDDVSYIRNIHLIDADPADDKIEFSFEAVKKIRMSGSINDENMRSILMYAVMNGNNPGVRLNSLNALNAAAQESYDPEIKDAIISAVKYDDNPGVRREAMKFLKNFPFDQEIKRSYLFVILNDTSSGLRIEAINELIEAANNGASLTREDRDLFKEKFLQDDNSYIRLRAKTVLEEYN